MLILDYLSACFCLFFFIDFVSFQEGISESSLLNLRLKNVAIYVRINVS